MALETIPPKAVILAAGRGERLRPPTDGLPKPMLPIGGRPLLEHLLAILVAADVREVAINLHHRPEAVYSYLGDGSQLGLRVLYSQEETLLGTAGALRRLEHFLDRTFFVLYGDVLSGLDLRRLAEFHRQRGGALTMALYREKDLARCGVAEVEPGGRIRRFVEKPKEALSSPWAAAGVRVMEPWVLRFIPEGFSDLGGDLFPRLVELGVPMFGYRCCGYFLDIGSPERYRKAQADAARGLVRLLALPVQQAGLNGGYVRLLTPPESRLVAATERARSIGGEEISEEDGKIVFGRFLGVSSGQEKALQIEYVSPTVVDTEPGCQEYRLFIQKQPGQQVLPATVRVVPPSGMKIRSVVVDGDAYPADSEIALVLEHDWTLESEPGPA